MQDEKGDLSQRDKSLFDNALHEDILLDSPSNYNGISGVTTMVHTVVIDFAIDDRACSTVDRTHK